MSKRINRQTGELCKRMWQLQSFTFSPLAENTYLLWNGNKHCVIIDPGCYTAAERQTLQSFITANELQPRLLLNTHCHLDHVFGEKWVAETYGLVPHIHLNEQFVMQFAEASGQMWGIPFTNYTGPFRFLAEGQTLHLGEDELQVLYIPGHSPGHVCFYCPAQGFVVAGDTLFTGSIGRTDLPGGNHITLIERIKSELFSLPDDTIVYPGHGGSTTVGEEKRSNPFLQ
jgi:hydroxyacylglutathione hydrolase